MFRKTIIIMFLFVAFATMTCIGCNPHEEIDDAVWVVDDGDIDIAGKTLADVVGEKQFWENGRMEKILNKNLNMPIEELPLCDYLIISVAVGNRYFPRELAPSVSSVGYTLLWFNNGPLSVKNMQRIDDSHIAVIYKVINYDFDEVYAFVVFDRNVRKSENTKYESWEKTGELYFISELHDYDEYSDVKIGDSIKTLYSIDQSIKYDVLRKEHSNVQAENGEIEQNEDGEIVQTRAMVYKVLSDGILTIEYNIKDWSILDIDFYSKENGTIPYGVTSFFEPLLSVFETN